VDASSPQKSVDELIDVVAKAVKKAQKASNKKNEL
jgi:hypothetical protein